jgi:hypothetical protein
MSEKRFNVHFLCTGNSARSVMAKSFSTRWAGTLRCSGAGSHAAGPRQSAGSRPPARGQHAADDARSKNCAWDTSCWCREGNTKYCLKAATMLGFGQVLKRDTPFDTHNAGG